MFYDHLESFQASNNQHSVFFWRQGIQHNDSRQNDTQHNDTQHNDTQHNDTQLSDT